MIGLPPMTEPSMTPDVFPSKMQVSRRSLRSAPIASPLNEDPSPEVTTCLGGLMMQRSRQFSEADLSTFEPGEESTRAFKLLQPPSFSGQSRLGQMTDNESPEVPVKKVTATGSDPSLNFGDVTTFSPAEKSTRAVNKLFSLPSVKLRPQGPAERPISPLASASELAPSAAEAEVDVTRPGSALSDAPPVETMETLEAEMEATGPPEAAPGITPTSSQPHPQWKTGVSRLLNEGEESPPKRMRMDEEEEVLNVHKENVPNVETFPRDANEGNNISKVSVRSHLRDPNEEDGKISYEDEQKQLEMTKDAPNTSSVSTSISNHEVSNRSLLASHEHSTNNEEVPVSIEDMEEVVEEVQDIEHEISRSLHIKETHETSCSKHNIKEVEHIKVEVLEGAKQSEITLSTVAATGVVIEDNFENIVETEVQNGIEEEFVVKDIEISVFHDLATKQAAAGRRDWELVRSDGAMAVFGFMERSLLLLLLLGDQLQSKRSRKSAGRAVNHWTVRDIRLVSTHRGDGSWEESSDDAILDTAHHCVRRKLSEMNLRSECPNTHSLSSFLKTVSMIVSPAITFARSLQHIRGKYFPFHIAQNVVTFGLVSSKLEQVIDVQINFGDGFGAAPRSFKIVKIIGDVKEETVRKIVNGVVPGPEYAKDVAHLLELYFRDKEKKMEKLRKY